MTDQRLPADPVRTTIRVRQGKIFGWHWKFMYWDGMYRVHWWRQSDGPGA